MRGELFVLHQSLSNTIEKSMDVGKLTYTPNNLSTWRRQFLTYAITHYGDAGTMLDTGSMPEYIENEFPMPEAFPKHKDMEFEIIKTKYLAHTKKVERFEESTTRLYGDIILHMSEASITQMESHIDEYAEVIGSRCPLTLWKLVIKSHTFAGKEASFLEKEKAKSRLQALKQGSQSLAEHHARFDQKLQICEDMQIDPEPKWVIYTYLLSLNVATFGQIVTEMLTEMDTDRFPATLEDAKRRIDRFSQSSRQVGLHVRKTPRDQDSAFAHHAADHDDQKQIQCAFCDKTGHSAQECFSLKRWRAKNPNTNPPRQNKGILKKPAHTKKKFQSQRSQSEKSVSFAQSDSEWVSLCSTVGVDSGDIDDYIIDSGANVSVVKSTSGLSDLKTISPISVNGIGSGITSKCVGTHRLFGQCYFAPECRINILSQHRLAERYSIQFDSEVGDFFTLTPKDQSSDLPILTFAPGPDRLYHLCHDLAQVYGASFRHRAPRDPSQPRTQEEINRARGVLELHAGLNHPGDDALSKLLDNGGIIGCPWTSSDLRLARQIFGECTKCRVGKTTNPSAISSTPDELVTTGQLLHCDIFFITSEKGTKAPYLLSVEDTVNYLMAARIPSKRSNHLLEAFTRMFNAYKSYGWTVRSIRTDREVAFKALESELNGMGIQCMYSGRGLHERRAERSTRVVKERVRILRLTQVYRLPARLNEAAVIDTIVTLNMTPNKRSGVRTPKEVVTGKKVIAPKDIRIEFGKLVQVKTPNQPSSGTSEESRVEDAIVVGRDPNSNGGIRVFTLDSLRIVSRSTFKPCLFTPTIINTVNRIADHDRSRHSNDPVTTYEDHPNPPDWSRDDDDAPELVSDDESDDDEDTVPSQSTDHSPPVLVPEDDQVAGPDQQDDSDPERRSEPTRDHSRDRDEDPTAFLTSSDEMFAFNLSVREALRAHPGIAEDAIVREMDQLFQGKRALIPVSHADTSGRKHSKILPSSMFCKEKRSAMTNTLEKIKARLVGGGHMTDRTLYTSGDTSSPTVKTESVMTILSVAAYEKRTIATMDIPGAYLNADLEHPHIIRIPKDVTEVYVRHKPHLRKYVQPNGTMLADAVKALYGLPEAGLRWHRTISGVLLEAGFRISDADPCVFIYVSKRGKCTIALHVDDLLVTTTSKELTEWLEKLLSDKFGKVTTETESQIPYLGMVLTVHDQGHITVSMPAYIDELLRDHSDGSKAKTPATKHLFRNDKPGDPVDASEYLSLLMKLMYLAKRIRPDILLACSHLATRAKCPDTHDRCKLLRVLAYINGTKDLTLTLDPDSITLECWADASYGVHPDGKGHTGIVMKIGSRSGGTILAKSVKQKCVSRSSSESELISADTGIPPILVQRTLFSDLGYPQPPTVLYQDNKSSISLSENGTSRSGRTQHIRVRYHYLQERILNGDIRLCYKPTKEMIADILTKPLGGQNFTDLRQNLLQ